MVPGRVLVVKSGEIKPFLKIKNQEADSEEFWEFSQSEVFLLWPNFLLHEFVTEA